MRSRRDGFRVLAVPDLRNPYAASPKSAPRFRFSLNKLLAWRLTEYARVVLLDADSLVLRNMDELFSCGQFCAVFLNPCIFHTGLMVLQPSAETFSDMVQKMGSLPSSDEADQGFLNSYFPDLLSSPLFKAPKDPLNNATPLQGLYRLPLGYQMDAIYYNLKFRWEVPCSEHKVITFPGSSALKPWFWWSWPVFPIPLQWHRARYSTIGFEEETLPCAVLAILWACALLWHPLSHTATDLLRYWRARQVHGGRGPMKGVEHRATLVQILAPSAKRSRLKGTRSPTPKDFTRAALLFAAVPVAAGVSFAVIPSTAHTFVGWSLFFGCWLALLRMVDLKVKGPQAMYWLPCYAALSMVTVGLPIYSILAFKLVALHVVAFGGGVVVVLVHRAIMNHCCERNLM